MISKLVLEGRLLRKEEWHCSCGRIMEGRKSGAMFRHAFPVQFLSGIMRGDASTTSIDKTQKFSFERETKLEMKCIKEARDGHDGTGLSVTLHCV